MSARAIQLLRLLVCSHNLRTGSQQEPRVGKQGPCMPGERNERLGELVSVMSIHDESFYIYILLPVVAGVSYVIVFNCFGVDTRRYGIRQGRKEAPQSLYFSVPNTTNSTC